MTNCELISESTLCSVCKNIHDAIHGFIPLTLFACKVIDNPIFQRLRKLKQLGTCNYVYHNAVHTRFEHSIGTYHLAGRILTRIASITDPKEIDTYLSEIPELKAYYTRTYDNAVHILDNYVQELIKIAALCHDIGHGPFSHVFDDVFIIEMKKQNSTFATHEARSGALLEKLIKSDPILSKIVMTDEIQFMKNLINPTKQNTGFIYQIVSNSLNGLDVDKYDYLTRDSFSLNIKSGFEFQRLIDHVLIIDNNICYPEQATTDIYNLYVTRHSLHRRVYSHKGVISAQYMIVELMINLDPILKISEAIEDLDKFIILNDDYILESTNILSSVHLLPQFSKNISNAKKILALLNSHKLYLCIGWHISKNSIDVDVDKLFNYVIDKTDVLVFQNKIGFVSGNKSNPLDNIFVFKTKDVFGMSPNIKSVKCNKDNITLVMPTIHQEYITMIFYKQREETNIIDEMKQTFKEFTCDLSPI